MTDPANRLASEAEHAVDARRLAAMLALVLAMTLGANALAIRLSPVSERKHDGRIVRAKWDLASQGVPAGGIAVTGDSSGNFAVVAEILENELGRPTRNYCTYGRVLATGAGWFLDRAIERADGPPSLALVVLGSRTYALPPDGFAFPQVPIGFGAWRTRAPRVPLTPVETFQFAAARLLPLYAQHKSFELGITKGRWSIDPSVLPITERGDSILPRAYPDGVAPFADKVLAEIASLEGPVPSEREREALSGLVRDAEARGYDVVFVDGPIWSGLAARPEHVAFLGRAHAYLELLCASSDRAWRLPGPLQTFEPAEMENPYHLTRPAAERFSAELARRLETLGLPR
ncbi:MAG: hypothetical protein AAF957_15775 [Planctomycetota bacterium]